MQGMRGTKEPSCGRFEGGGEGRAFTLMPFFSVSCVGGAGGGRNGAMVDVWEMVTERRYLGLT